jgi:glycosyltransferase involved in cell wall biosynthesis
VFELERDLLISNGHDVETLTRHSDILRNAGNWGAIIGAASTPWNPWAARAVRRKVEKFRPDVVHVHNTFPLLSPSIFPAIGTQAARVLTLHNYRLFCPAAIPLRDGHPCTLCLDRHSVVPSVRYACYRRSRIATLPLAVNVALARATSLWQRHVDVFIALTEFQRDLMVSAGLPAERVFVKPNFYPGAPRALPWAERADAVVFVGRISEEKGLGHLIDAWTAWGASAPELRVVGDGPLRTALAARTLAARLDQVHFLGQLSPKDAAAEIASARLLVLPSICLEGFPMVLREAFAFGTSVAVSNVGPLAALVDKGRAGLIFEPANSESLLEVVRTAWLAPGRLEGLGAASRDKFNAEYREEKNHAELTKIYEWAVESCRRRRR